MKVQSFSVESISSSSWMPSQTWKQDFLRSAPASSFQAKPLYLCKSIYMCWDGGWCYRNLSLELIHVRECVMKGWGGGENIFPLWDTCPLSGWPGPVCVINVNNPSYQGGAAWFKSWSQLTLSTGQVCGFSAFHNWIWAQSVATDRTYLE